MQIELVKLDAKEDFDFFAQRCVCTDADRAAIFRLEPDSCKWLWNKTVPGSARIGNEHWSKKYTRWGPSYQTYADRAGPAALEPPFLWEDDWRDDVAKFLSSLEYADDSDVYWLCNCEYIYFTNWRIFLRTWRDFRPNLEISIVLNVASNQFAVLTNYGDTWIGERPAIDFHEIDT